MKLGDITIFGASLTWGAWDNEYGGWVNRLRLFIDKTDKDSFIYNLSIPGETSEDLLERFEGEASARDPDTIIFSIGGNDSMFIMSEKSLNVEPDQFEKNITSLIKKAKKITSDIIVVGLINIDESRTTPVQWEEDLYYTNENIIIYNDIWQRVCNNFKVPFVDVYGILNNKDYEDGLHPNAKGHQKIFSVVQEFIANNYI